MLHKDITDFGNENGSEHRTMPRNKKKQDKSILEHITWNASKMSAVKLVDLFIIFN